MMEIPLLPNEYYSPVRNQSEQTNLGVYSTYDIPYVEALVQYFHEAAGYSVSSTWFNAIKSGNYTSWPGIAYNNASQYFPSGDKPSRVT